jgi:ABC-2 type transport system ATP-binding protein
MIRLRDVRMTFGGREALAGLDPNQARQARRLMAGLGGGRQTLVLATHDLREVEAVCNRVLILHRGRLVADGAPEELAAGERDGLDGLFARATGEQT